MNTLPKSNTKDEVNKWIGMSFEQKATCALYNIVKWF